MTEQVKNTKETEVKGSQAEKTDEKSSGEEKTIGEVLQPKPKESETKKEEPETVGLDKFLEIKKENKELKKAMKDLEAKITEGDSSKEEINADIEAIAEEFEVDKKFLKKLEKAIKANLEADVDSKLSEKLKHIEEREKEDKIDKVFNDYFKKAIDKMPEYEGIVNKEVIKTLSLQKGNSNKTLSQLIEETYGNAISGKRTIETTVPRGGKEPQEIDFAKARKDTAYFKEIMSDPELKKKYNESLVNRIQF